jgi:hypothetical protein
MTLLLGCEAIVWRLLRKKAWLDQDALDADIKVILPDAYLRRKEVDTNGLSVGIKGRCTLEEFKASLNKVHGVVSLHVGRVRDLGLDVFPDDPQLVEEQGHEYNPCHANIINVPYVDDDPKEAERLAGLLAKQSRWVLT